MSVFETLLSEAYRPSGVPTRIETPPHLRVDHIGCLAGTSDMNLELVHDMHDRPSHWCHEVAIADQDIKGNMGSYRLARLSDAGFLYSRGFRGSDGRQWWVYNRRINLRHIEATR